MKIKKYLIPYIIAAIAILIFIPLPNILSIAVFLSIIGSINLLSNIPSWLKPNSVPLLPINDQSHNTRVTLYSIIACTTGALLLLLPLPNITTILLFILFTSSACTVSIAIKNILDSAFASLNNKIGSLWKKDSNDDEPSIKFSDASTQTATSSEVNTADNAFTPPQIQTTSTSTSTSSHQHQSTGTRR